MISVSGGNSIDTNIIVIIVLLVIIVVIIIVIAVIASKPIGRRPINSDYIEGYAKMNSKDKARTLK